MTSPDSRSRACLFAASALLVVTFRLAAPAAAQVKAQVRPAPTPAWNKGILPISPESYYNAIECGKQGGDDPACVFWDTDICKNDDFALAWYTPYKQVAYQVWMAVRKKQPAPQPNYQAAQQTRVTIGVTLAKGSTNALSDLAVKRGGKPAMAVDRSLAAGGGRFTFPTDAFAAAGGALVLDLVGKEKTVSCTIDAATLRRLR
jgi:hypothetical protein